MSLVDQLVSKEAVQRGGPMPVLASYIAVNGGKF